MSSLCKIQTQYLCRHHSLPYAYICVTKFCTCQVKLCEKCQTQHEAENQNSNLMKIDNYLSKVQTEVGIVKKQQEKLDSMSYKKLQTSFKQIKQKVEKFNINQVKILEDSMKYLNEESFKVKMDIKQACQVLLAKMTNIELKRKELPELFCRKLVEDKLIETMIMFYSQSGFASFRRKLDKALQFRAILKDFLSYADKFGNKYEQFIKSSSQAVASDFSMQSTIREILKEKNLNINIQDGGQLQFRQNNFVTDRQPQRQKRARTIFGK